MTTPRSRFPAYPPSTDKDLAQYLEALRQELEAVAIGGGATIRVEESGVAVSSAAGTLDFLGGDFDLTASLAGAKVSIQLVGGFARTNVANTWTALQTFNAGVSIGAAGTITFVTGGAALSLTNRDITGVNSLTIADPGPNEGVLWAGGNLWRIYESPDDLTTNSGGNLQFVQNATRRMTIKTDGSVEVPGTFVVGAALPSGTLQITGSVRVSSEIRSDSSMAVIRVGGEPSLRFQRDLTDNPRWDLGRMSSTAFRVLYADDLTSETIRLQLSSVGTLTVFDTAGDFRWSVGQSGTATGMELGRIDGTSATAFIDFHSGATPTDFDARIISSGGSGVSGGSTLQLAAASFLPTSAGGTAFGSISLPWGNAHHRILNVYDTSSVLRGKFGESGGSSILDIGRVDGTADTSILAFHAGTVPTGGDASFQCVSGSGVFGEGALFLFAGEFFLSVPKTTIQGGGDLEFSSSGSVLNWAAGTLTIQRAGVTKLSATSSLTTSSQDFAIGTLGTFDSADIPTDLQLLVYHAGGVNKWQAESIQFVYNAGDSFVSLLGDGTSVAALYFDLGAGADSPVGAPPAPVLQLHVGHKAITVSAYASLAPDVFYHDGPSFPADFRHFLYEYSLDNFGTAAISLATASSDKVVHGRLIVGTTYYYRVRTVDRAGNASANSAVVSAVAAANSDTAAYGVLLASEIAVDRLAALSANMGILTAGQIRGPGNTAGINFSGVGGIPSTWVDVINFENTTIPTGAKFIIDFFRNTITVKDEQATPRTRIEMGELGAGLSDWGFHLGADNGNLVLDMHGDHFYMQDSAATPLQGILLDGTRPSSWKRYLDLVDGVFTIKDDQGSPMTRVQVGKVGAGVTDYGLQVFDVDGATVVDVTGSKRILAVPVQASVDSGTSLTIDLTSGLTRQLRLTGIATLTLTNPVNGARYRIWFQQDTTGSRPFPAIKNAAGYEIVMFTNGVAPTLTATPGALDLFEFEYRTSPTSRFTCMPLQTNVLLPTPNVPGTIQSDLTSTTATDHNVNMPSPVVFAGELLLVMLAVHTTVTVNTPSGWTHEAGSSSNPMWIFSKIADGTEGGTTVNFTTSAGAAMAAHCYRLSRTNGEAEVTAASGSSTSPDCPNHTPSWSVDRTLWIAAAATFTAGTFNGDPTDYSNFTTVGTGVAGPRLRTGRRILYATSENPSTYSLTASQSWSADTISVRPPL